MVGVFLLHFLKIFCINVSNGQMDKVGINVLNIAITYTILFKFSAEGIKRQKKKNQ